jgi:hypothetical protein
MHSIGRASGPWRLSITAVMVLGLLSAARMATGEAPLKNTDVIALARAGLGDDVVIAKIKQASTEEMDVSTDALIALRKGGLTKNVISAMVVRVSQRIPPTPVPTPLPTAAPTVIAAASDVKSTNPSTQKNAGGARVEGDAHGGSAADPGKPCMANFKAEGGFWKGEIFRSFQEFEGVNKGKAFENILQAVLAAPNMVVSSSSKETGTISGQGSFSPVLGGAPKPAPLGVTFKDLPSGGFRVNIQFNVPSGTVAKKKMVQEEFCTLLESAF